uniref:SCP domain-containing protein n=1 Tax=Anolis carolinensis TaxID=28377 RepID=L7MZR4_ANOCA
NSIKPGLSCQRLSWLESLASQIFAPYPDINNKTFIKLYVDAHNKFRSEVKPSAANMLYMTFDVALARIAKAYAKKCIWDHNEDRHVHPDPKFRPFGENMWMGGASERPFNVAAAIEAFHSEIKYYDFSTHKCTHVCGHYTQVSFILPCSHTLQILKHNISILGVLFHYPGGIQNDTLLILKACSHEPPLLLQLHFL